MNRSGDAASCAALAGRLRVGASRLREAGRVTAAVADPSKTAALAESLDRLAVALDDFAAGLRAPRPPRSGLPHPHTALRRACEDVTRRLAPGGPDSPA